MFCLWRYRRSKEPAQIRADYNYEVVDSLHLPTAIVGNCDLFLTNDVRLAGFPGIPVEILQ